MSIHTKSISELKDYKFYVPAYQRGYRWTEDEVTALLEDISEFVTNEDKAYCIQPLIVKPRGNLYEVVDGQQRLTTIYIFMKIAVQEMRSATPPFELEYETRQDSACFLQSLSDETDFDTESDKNIDYFHISATYKIINNWLENQKDKSTATQKLNTKIREHVFFIWYELPNDADPISMFTKVDIGKIPLTSAELIKALLLNKDNFAKNTEKKQVEISLAWDKIEQGLHDDSFWYFLNEAKTDGEKDGTRIDMLFELLASDFNKKLNEPISPSQKYFPFLVFLEYLKINNNQPAEKEKAVTKIWGKVEQLYAEFRYWYNDLEKYHIIGYLITSGVKIEELFEIMRNKKKSEITHELYKRAKREVREIDLQSLQSLFYGQSYRQNKSIQNILLFFNIATIVCKSAKEYRFPFNIYKNKQWDIEHIHASADESDEADDCLHNLALLDSKTNKSYKNKPFLEKRKIILDYESKGLFVPLCTKNVFLKAYTKEIQDMDKWNDNDKEDYLLAVSQVFKDFFKDISYE